MVVTIKIIMIRSHFPDIKLNKAAKSLLKGGYAVVFVAWDRGRFPGYKVDEGIKVHKMNLNVSPGNVKVAFYLPLFWIFVIFQLLTQKWDIVHCVDFDAFIPTLLVAKLKKKPIVYDIFDFYADTIEFPLFPKISRNIITKIDRILIRFADLVIIVDEYRKKQIGDNYKNLLIIYNSPVDVEESERSKENINQNFSIFFGGRVSRDRCINELIMVVSKLKDVNLTVMGFCEPNEYKNELIELSNGFKNIKLHLEATDHDDILRETLKSDLILAAYDPNIPNNIYSSPNKLFEAMMCEKPILVSNKTSVSYIVKKEHCGMIIPYGDLEVLKNIIIKLKNDQKLCQNLGKNGRKAYEIEYNWKIMEKRLLKAYEYL